MGKELEHDDTYIDPEGGTFQRVDPPPVVKRSAAAQTTIDPPAAAPPPAAPPAPAASASIPGFDARIGTTIGEYRVIALLGQGAMGRVYRVVHPTDGVRALKLIDSSVDVDPKLVKRLEREARAAGDIRHPNTITFYEFGRTPAGECYLVMELLSGKTLEHVIYTERPFSFERIVSIVHQILSGLEQAHRLGFVHRDLKPANVMLVREGDQEVAKVLDFGLVARTTAGGEETQLTATGHFVGTPVYIAPEQIYKAKIAPTADLYAVGVILYEMIAGVPPFDGEILDVLMAHTGKEPPPLPPADGLDKLAMALLVKDPAKRPQSALAVLAELDRIVSDRYLAQGQKVAMAAEPTRRVPREPASRPLISRVFRAVSRVFKPEE